jgi:hypothetical protein
MGGKYKKKDYENIANILRNVYRLVLAMNNPDCIYGMYLFNKQGKYRTYGY